MEQGVNRKPPEFLERLVSILIPPDYRDQVLGDLAERYRSAPGYFYDAASAIPAAIIGRIRRSMSLRVFLLQLVAVYASVAAAAATMIWSVEPQSFSQIAATTVVMMSALMTWRIYLSQRYTPRGTHILRVIRPDVFHPMYFMQGAMLAFDFWRHSHVFVAILTSFVGIELGCVLVSKLWDWADTHHTPQPQ